jgi:hypothetical protein
MLYSKNGSIPKPQTDGTDGWIEVSEPPVVPAGKEVVWWCPPGWVVRDLKPAQSVQSFNTYDEEGNVTGTEQKLADWSWSQSQEKWVAYPLPVVEEPVVVTPAEPDLSLGTAMPTTEI